jgi:hypothetical protein
MLEWLESQLGGLDFTHEQNVTKNSGSAYVIADLLESSEGVDPDDDGAYNCEWKIWGFGKGFECSGLSLGAF